MLHNGLVYSRGLSLVLSGIALVMGGMVYVFVRASKPVFFDWMRRAGIDSWFNPVSYNAPSISRHLPDWIVFSLPNGFWAFGYAVLITTIWSESKSWLRNYYWNHNI